MRKIFTLLLMTLILGCASKNEIPKEARTLRDAIILQKHNPQKAIVFAELESDDAFLGVRQEIFGVLSRNSTAGEIGFVGSFAGMNSQWQKALPELREKLKITGLNNFFFTEHKNWAYAEPGKYAVNYYHSTDNLRANLNGWARQDGKAYMVFDVLPGEVLYIGDIYAGLNRGQVSFVIKDDFEAMRESVPDELKKRLMKRMVKAPNALSAESITPYKNRTTTMSIPAYMPR